MKRLVAGCLGVLGAMLAAAGIADAQQAGQTVEVVRQRGTLRCGVQGPSNPGFGAPDSRGVWQGFNVDLCRAIAIMVLGDPSKITIVPLSTQARFPAMQSGEIDVMTNSTTWTMQRDAQLGFNFPAITFYDGQGIMVRRSMGIDSATKLDGATICVPPGTTTELNLADWFRARNLRFTPLVIESRVELTRAYDVGRCDAITYDSTILYAQRTTLQNPQDHIILPERLSKEPLSVTVRHGDDRFHDIVGWAVFTLINAEELGITSANAREQLNSRDPQVRRLLGVEGGLGQTLGIGDDFGFRMIEALGNYGEIFERNLGEGSPLGIERGMNRLYTSGGILYAPPNR
jgi:general L-amino acid transport system substrate-binding protein